MDKITDVYTSGDLKNKINETIDELENAKWKGGIVSQDILPSEASAISIGAADNKFKAIYADEVHISQNTLYIGNTPVIGTDADTINIKADPDQSVLVKTTGLGSTQLSSETGILLRTNGTTADININADGMSSQVTANATSAISLTAPDINLNGTARVQDLIVLGTTTTTNSANLTVSDNMIEVNSGETGTGVSAGVAGVKIDRGDALPYLFVFDEEDDMFKVGEQGDLEIIASQPYVNNKLDEMNPITNLSISGKVITYTKKDGTTGTITTQDTNTTYSDMTAATSSAAGKAGLVPAPAAGKQTSFLRGDGTWTTPSISSVLPGTVIAFAANSAPSGYVLCNGATVSRATYANLFAVIGTIYGAGDGSTTFTLPNLTNKFIMGSGTAGTVKAAGLPNITGTIYASNGWDSSGSNVKTGVFKSTVLDNVTGRDGGKSNYGMTLTFKASDSNSIYGASTTVQPPTVTMRYYIKY